MRLSRTLRLFVCMLLLAPLGGRGDDLADKLPDCPPGTASLDPWRTDWLTGYPRLNAKRKDCVKEWTVIVFLAMDNDLNWFGEDDLGELAWGKTQDKDHRIDVVVEADFRERAGKRYVFEASPERNGPGAAVVRDFHAEASGERNTGDPRTLEAFLEWAMENFPARRYALIVGGHGDGWAATLPKPSELGGANARDPGRIGNGIALDETTGDPALPKDWLTVSDLRRVLTRVANRHRGGKPLELYAADACFMQQAEVAFELRNQAKFIYGSVPVMAYQGLPYAALLKNFVDGKYPSERALALDLPQLMVDSYKDENPRVYASTVETEKLAQEFAPALFALGRAGSAWLASSEDRLMDAFRVTSPIANAITHQNSVVELRDLLLEWRKAFASMPGAAAERETLRANVLASLAGVEVALKNSVVASAAGERYAGERERIGGLSIWMPRGLPAYRSFQEHLRYSSLHRFGCDCAEDPLRPNDWGLFLRSAFTLPK